MKNLDVEKRIIQDLWFESMAIDGDTAWFVAGNFNALIEMNLLSMSMHVLGNVPNEKIDGVRLYSGIEKYNNLLVLVPMSAQEIAIFNLDSKEFSKIPIKRIDNRLQRYNENYKFFAHYLYKDTCYLIGHTYPGIIRLNMNDMSQSIIDSWVDEFEKDSNNPSKSYFMNDYCLKDNTLIIPASMTNKVLLLELETNETKVCTIGKPYFSFSGVAYDGSFFWIMAYTLNGNTIIRWDGKDIYEMIEIPEINHGWYIAAIYYNELVRFFPSWDENYIISINIKNKEIKREILGNCYQNETIYLVKQIRHILYIFSKKQKKMFIYDLDKRHMKELALSDADGSLNKRFIDIWWIQKNKQNEYFVENQFYNIDGYINFIKNSFYTDEFTNISKNVYDFGKQIHCMIKRTGK